MAGTAIPPIDDLDLDPFVGDIDSGCDGIVHRMVAWPSYHFATASCMKLAPREVYVERRRSLFRRVMSADCLAFRAGSALTRWATSDCFARRSSVHLTFIVLFRAAVLTPFSLRASGVQRRAFPSRIAFRRSSVQRGRGPLRLRSTNLCRCRSLKSGSVQSAFILAARLAMAFVEARTPGAPSPPSL